MKKLFAAPVLRAEPTLTQLTLQCGVSQRCVPA